MQSCQALAYKHPAYDAEPVYDGEVYASNYDIPEYDQAAVKVAAAGEDATDCDDEEEATLPLAAANYDDYRGYRPEDDPANTYVATVDSPKVYGDYEVVIDEVETTRVTYVETVDCVCSSTSLSS